MQGAIMINVPIVEEKTRPRFAESSEHMSRAERYGK